MQVVPKPDWVPHFCAVSGRSEDPDGFIDTENFLPFFEPRIYVSMTSARELGRRAGLVDREQWQDLIDQREESAARIAALEARVAELEAFKHSVAVLKSEGFVSSRPPGRPRKAEAERAAA
jgi:hypothetical protein